MVLREPHVRLRSGRAFHEPVPAQINLARSASETGEKIELNQKSPDGDFLGFIQRFFSCFVRLCSLIYSCASTGFMKCMSATHLLLREIKKEARPSEIGRAFLGGAAFILDGRLGGSFGLRVLCGRTVLVDGLFPSYC